jgi:hypothetical protein
VLAFRIRRPDLLLTVLCLLLPMALAVDAVCAPRDAGAGTPPREVGGRFLTAEERARAEDRGPPRGFDTELEVGAGVQSLSDEDLDRTYGLLPSIGVGASWRLAASTRLVIGARYACSRGDPYYDMPGFSGGDDATLRAVPLTIGVRANLNPGSRLRYHVGCALQLAWLQETFPVDGGPNRFTGYGIGPLVMTGPEWRSRDERRAVGLEFGLGARGGHVDHGTDRHDVDLTGVQVRLYYAFHPGAAAPREEGSR